MIRITTDLKHRLEAGVAKHLVGKLRSPENARCVPKGYHETFVAVLLGIEF